MGQLQLVQSCSLRKKCDQNANLILVHYTQSTKSDCVRTAELQLSQKSMRNMLREESEASFVSY